MTPECSPVHVCGIDSDPVEPDAARRPHRRLFVQLVLFSWILLLLQSIVLFPLLRSDPLFQDLPDGISITHTFWSMRLLAMAAAPLALAMRVFTLSVLLHGLLTWWNRRVRVGDVGAGVLRAEAIFLLEAACSTALLFVSPPGSLVEAESLRLRTGMDLLWQPSSPQWSAWLTSVNLFVVWWTIRIRKVVQTTYGTGRLAATALAVGLGLALVMIRALMLPT